MKRIIKSDPRPHSQENKQKMNKEKSSQLDSNLKKFRCCLVILLAST